jgi:hypothetical protein
MTFKTVNELSREIYDPAFFEGLSDIDDWDEALDKRDQAEFDDAWTNSHSAVSSKQYIDPADEAAVTNLRESVFKAVYRLTENSEVAGYVSDDFGLIGEAVAKGCFTGWIEWLYEVYKSRNFPC